MDPKLLQTTLARAMGLIPIMILQENLASIGINASKGIKGISDGVTEMLQIETLARKQLEMFTRELQKLGKEADRFGYVDDVKFNGLRENLQRLNSNMEAEFTADESQVKEWLGKVVAMTKTKIYTTSPDRIEAARGLIKQVIEYDLFQRMPKDKSVDFAWAVGTNLEKHITRVLNQLDETYKVGDDFWDQLGKLYNPNIEQGAVDETHKLIYALISKEMVKRTVGSAKITYLAGMLDESGERLKVDVTGWMKGLYKEDSTATTKYDVILQQAKENKLLMSLSGIRLSSESTLKALTDVGGRESVEFLIDTARNPHAAAFKNHLLEQFKSTKFEIGGEPVEIVNYGTVKKFFEGLHGTGHLNEGRGLSHFDIFRIAEEYVEFANVQRAAKGILPFILPTIKLDIEDIQRLTSGFSAAARETADAPKRRKLLQLSKSIFDTLDQISIVKQDGTVVGSARDSAFLSSLPEGEKTLKDLLRDYKDYHLNEIVRRFENGEVNPLGAKIHNTGPISARDKKVIDAKTGKLRQHRDFVEDPVEWINLREIFEAGSKGVDAGRNLVKQLEMTFGDFVPSPVAGGEGRYVLQGDAKEQVRVMLNSLLKREMGNLKHVQQSHAILTKFKKPRKGLEDVKLKEGVRELEAGKEILRKSLISANDLINDPGLKQLEVAGLLDLDDVVTHNLSLKRHLGSRAIEREVLDDIETEVILKTESLERMTKTRIKNLQRIMKNEGIPEAEKMEPEQAYEFFVSSKFGGTKYNKVLEGLMKLKSEGGGGYDEKTARAILSDFVMEGLSNRSYVTKVVEGSLPGTGFQAIDPDKFYTEVIINEKNLRRVVGDDIYRNAFEMAQMLKYVNRTSEEMISKIRVKFRIPGGLSVESWISRIYSMNRGIISPKYVATEAALLALRMRGANAMAKILSDPEAGEAVRLLLERGGNVSDKVHMKVQAVIFAALGSEMHRRREENIEEQIRKIRANPARFIKSNLPAEQEEVVPTI